MTAEDKTLPVGHPDGSEHLAIQARRHIPARSAARRCYPDVVDITLLFILQKPVAELCAVRRKGWIGLVLCSGRKWLESAVCNIEQLHTSPGPVAGVGRLNFYKRDGLSIR